MLHAPRDTPPKLLPGPFDYFAGDRTHEWRLAIADPYTPQHDWWIADIPTPTPDPLNSPTGKTWPTGWSRWFQAERGELTITLTAHPPEPAALYPGILATPAVDDHLPVYTLNVMPTPRLFAPDNPRDTTVRRLQVACQDKAATWRLILHYLEPGSLFNRAARHPTLNRALTLHWTDAARG